MEVDMRPINRPLNNPRSDTSGKTKGQRERFSEEPYLEREFLEGWFNGTRVPKVVLVPLRNDPGAYYLPRSEGKDILKTMGIKLPRVVRLKTVCWECLLDAINVNHPVA